MTLRAVALGIVLLCAVPIRVRAEEAGPIAEVQRHDRRAQQRFEEGDFHGALDELRAAQRLLPAPERLFSMAVCEQRLDHPQEAIDLYQRYLDDPDSDDEHRDLARRRLGTLRAEISEGAGEGGGGEEEPPELFGLDEGRHPAEPAPGLRRLSRTPFLAMVGVTGAAWVAVAILGGATLVRHQQFQDTDPGPLYDELQEVGRVMAWTTDALLGVACASTAVALVLAIFTDWGPRPVGSAHRGLAWLGLGP